MANQAALLLYIDLFSALGLLAIVMVPIVLVLLGGKSGERAMAQ